MSPGGTMVWAALGVVGAAASFTANPWPAPGMRLRNATLATLGAMVALGLWLAGRTDAWVLAAAWYAAFLLLQATHRLTAPGRWIWPRIAAVAAIVLGTAWMIGG